MKTKVREYSKLHRNLQLDAAFETEIDEKRHAYSDLVQGKVCETLSEESVRYVQEYHKGDYFCV